MRLLSVLLALPFLAACAMNGSERPALATVDYVDLERFMGDWYVIAHIPTFPERKAHNAIERYALDDDGSIATTFSFNQGALDGRRREMTPRGFVVEGSGNAEWGMQFVWPFKGEFLIVYLDEDYATTIIARNKRDYVWLMARQPHMPEAEIERFAGMIAEMGYDIEQLRLVPHSPAP
jgi:apolipoprotein D and lipocalin family protein